MGRRRADSGENAITAGRWLADGLRGQLPASAAKNAPPGHPASFGHIPANDPTLLDAFLKDRLSEDQAYAWIRKLSAVLAGLSDRFNTCTRGCEQGPRSVCDGAVEEKIGRHILGLAEDLTDFADPVLLELRRRQDAGSELYGDLYDSLRRSRNRLIVALARLNETD
jgi:hypothetical protein